MNTSLISKPSQDVMFVELLMSKVMAHNKLDNQVIKKHSPMYLLMI